MLGFLKLLKLQNLKDWIGQLPTINQFIIIFSGFVILIGIQITLSFALFFATDIRTNSGIVHLNKQLQLISKLKTELIQIQVLGNEKYSRLTQRTASKLLNQFPNDARLIPQLNVQYIKTSISKLTPALSGGVSYAKYQIVRAEVAKLGILLEEQEQVFQGQRNDLLESNLGQVLLWLLFILIGGGFVFWMIITIKVVEAHQDAIEHFEDVAARYRQGHLEEIIDLPGKEYQELKIIIEDHFDIIRESYRNFQTNIKDLAIMIRDLSMVTRQNDNEYMNLRKRLRKIIDDSYHTLDFFPNMSETIKNLNMSIVGSQQESIHLHQSFEKASEIFRNAPLDIIKVANEIEVRDRNTGEIFKYLKELRQFIDNIQIVISVFDSIAQQTTVLSLNASIEAARAGALGSGFDIAATEIDSLADRINIIPQELLKVISKVQKRMLTTIRATEMVVPQHKHNTIFFEVTKVGLEHFWNELATILKELREFNNLVNEFEARQKSLGELITLLAKLNQEIPLNYQKISAALDVIEESGQLASVIGRISLLIDQFDQKLTQFID